MGNLIDGQPSREGTISVSMNRLRDTVGFVEGAAQELMTRTTTIRSTPPPSPETKSDVAEDPIDSSCDLAHEICECAGRLSDSLRTLNRLMEELEL